MPCYANEKGKWSAVRVVRRYAFSLCMFAFTCWILWLMLSDDGRALTRALCDTALLASICPR